MVTRRLAAVVTTALGLALAAASSAAGAPTLLAELRDGADARDVARDAGLALAREFPQIGWAEYEVPAGDPVAPARAELLDDGRVFRLDFQRRGEKLEPQYVPNDEFTAAPPVFSSDGVPTDYYWEQAGFYPGWDIERGSLGTRVAVIDSEINGTHPDLASKVVAAYNAEAQFPPTYRSADTRATPQQIADEQDADPNNDDLHGTHVAGLAAAATDNGVGVSGAGFDAGLMPVKITLRIAAGQTDATYIANAVDGITWAADNGADVINMSFGSPSPNAAIRAAVDYAISKDVLPVAAAGNNQDDPAPSGGQPLYPAAFDGVLAVGATDSDGDIEGFSTNGAYVDAAAPGSRILSAWDPRVPGNPRAGYTVLSGTSMASPLVAGLAALVRDLRPDLPAPQVKAIIEASATDRGAPGRDDAFGAGIVNASAALQAAGGAVPTAPAPPPPAPPAPTPPPAAAPSPPPPAAPPARRGARLVYRCSVGDERVPTATARPVAVTRGQRLTCRGRSLPALAGARVEVQRLVRGRWRAIETFATAAGGRFGFSIRLGATGPWTLRAALVGTAAIAPLTGPQARVAVTSRR